MKQYLKKINITTKQQFEIVDITQQVERVVEESGVRDGLVVVGVNHTTASIRLNHFEPMLLQDIHRIVHRLVPQDENYNHDLFELRQNVSPDERTNGHAHIKAFLLGSSENVIVESGKLLLGARQSILFVELDGSRKREFYVKVIGE